jgi:hypothetical protein
MAASEAQKGFAKSPKLTAGHSMPPLGEVSQWIDAA